MLVGEGILYANNHGNVPMEPWAEVTVAAALGALVLGSILLAVVPGWDPFDLSLRGRTAYVYAAEALLAVFCLHLRLTFPELFALGIIRRYWMLIVMAIAFAGAGLSELFHRRRVPVLSEPLAQNRPGAALGAGGGLLVHGRGLLDSWSGATPALWFLMGLFYGMLSVMRRSPWLAALAIAAGNMGLWVFWSRCGLNFLDHPQLWLIPAALCALVAEYLHRDRLEPGQSAGLRYLALGTIYLSSTTDFMQGVGESVWLPLVLVGLSLLGVLAGILLRIRSFLYLGVLFLMVVLVRMIIYAAFEQGQMWTFWTAVRLLGRGDHRPVRRLRETPQRRPRRGGPAEGLAAMTAGPSARGYHGSRRQSDSPTIRMEVRLHAPNRSGTLLFTWSDGSPTGEEQWNTHWKRNTDCRLTSCWTRSTNGFAPK